MTRWLNKKDRQKQIRKGLCNICKKPLRRLGPCLTREGNPSRDCVFCCGQHYTCNQPVSVTYDADLPFKRRMSKTEALQTANRVLDHINSRKTGMTGAIAHPAYSPKGGDGKRGVVRVKMTQNGIAGNSRNDVTSCLQRAILHVGASDDIAADAIVTDVRGPRVYDEDDSE